MPRGLTSYNRKNIKAGEIIDDLQSYVLKIINRNGIVVDLSPQQIKAAGILLKKTMPDLKAVEFTDADGKPIKQMIVQFSSGAPTLTTQQENSNDIKQIGNDTAE